MKFKINKPTIIIALLIGALIFAYGIREALIVGKAHQTFENYYTFRGCSSLVRRTNDYGLYKLPSGQTIKLVKFHGKWYLDGDLPTCFSNICF